MATWPASGETDWNTKMLAYLAIGHETDGTHGTKSGFQDRGDPASSDLEEGGGESDFSSVGDVDGTWFEFDMNSIAGVPTAAKAILVDLLVRDAETANVAVEMRDSDQSNTANRGRLFIQATGVNNTGDFIIPITDGKIDIRGSGLKFSDFTSIVLTVKGWWI